MEAPAAPARAWFQGLPGRFWWLWVSMLTYRLGNFVVPFMALFLIQKRGISVSLLGLIVALYALGGAVSAVVAGVVVDRFGRRPVLIAAQLANAACTLAFLFGRDPVVLAIIALFVGFSAGATRPAAAAMMIDMAPADKRMTVFSLNYWAMNAGFAIASFTARILVTWDYRALFVADAISTALCAVLIYLKVPETKPTCSPANTKRSGRVTMNRVRAWLRGERVFVVILVLVVLEAAVLQQMTVTLPIAMHDAGHSAATYGFVIAINGLLVCVFQIPVARLAATRPIFKVLAMGAALLGVGFGLTAFAGSIPLYIVTIAIWTAGEILNAPAAPAVVAQLAPADSHGSYQGAYSAAWSIGCVLAPLAGGFIYEGLGGAVLWAICAVAGLGVGGIYLVSGARYGRLPTQPQMQLQTLEN